MAAKRILTTSGVVLVLAWTGAAGGRQERASLGPAEPLSREGLAGERTAVIRDDLDLARAIRDANAPIDPNLRGTLERLPTGLSAPNEAQGRVHLAPRAGNDRDVEIARNADIGRVVESPARLQLSDGAAFVRAIPALDPNAVRVREVLSPRHAQPYRRVPTEILQRMIEVVPKLDWGRAEFSIPARIRAHKDATIELEYARETPVNRLQGPFASRLGISDPQHVEISNDVRAALVGHGFAIVPVTPEHQFVPGGSKAVWKWAVRAKEPGSQKLHLTTSCLVSVFGNIHECSVRTFEEDVEVVWPLQDRVLAWVDRHVSWLVPAVAVPLLAAVYAAWRKRRKTSGVANPP